MPTLSAGRSHTAPVPVTRGLAGAVALTPTRSASGVLRAQLLVDRPDHLSCHARRLHRCGQSLIVNIHRSGCSLLFGLLLRPLGLQVHGSIVLWQCAVVSRLP